MKKLLLIIVFITNIIIAQTTVGFETLTVPASGYFNGSTEYSGSGNQETITFEEAAANFHVNYTDTGAYDYWSSFAYTNQTDLTTASYTNYSAYSATGGGANSSSNYVIAYLYGPDAITFDNEVSITSVDLTNAVWTYHYMNGSDGSGTGTYVANDYFKITITGMLNNGTLTTPLEFFLADFTNGNTTIINEWATVDLSSFGTIVGLQFQLEASDNYTPYYFCMDNIVYSDVASTNDSVFENSISMFPNPATNFVKVTNIENATIAINDINGKVIFSKEQCLETENINLQQLNSGVYFVKIKNNKNIAVKKLFIK
ncbi:MAG TPA: DUF4465 domain-containing protein [Lutibacter sp.]|nr:DUF4465 domain-containing protein [Lutibacter sp.]